MFAAQWSVGPTTPASHRAIILHGVVRRTAHALDYVPVGSIQSEIPITIYDMTTQTVGYLNNAGLREQVPSLRKSQLRPFTRNPLCFLTSQGR